MLILPNSLIAEDPTTQLRYQLHGTHADAMAEWSSLESLSGLPSDSGLIKISCRFQDIRGNGWCHESIASVADFVSGTEPALPLPSDIVLQHAVTWRGIIDTREAYQLKDSLDQQIADIWKYAVVTVTAAIVGSSIMSIARWSSRLESNRVRIIDACLARRVPLQSIMWRMIGRRFITGVPTPGLPCICIAPVNAPVAVSASDIVVTSVPTSK